MARTHIDSWAYDDNTSVSYAGGGTAPAALVQNWVSYAEALSGNTKLLTDQSAGIPKALMYLDVMKIYVNSDGSFNADSIPMVNAGLPETAWLHIPGTSVAVANRLKGTPRGDGTYSIYPNLSDTNAVNWLVGYCRSNYSSYNGFMLDDWDCTLANGGLLYQVQGGYTTALEYATDAAMRSAMSSFLSSLTRSNGTAWQNVANCLGSANQFLPSGVAYWLGAPNLVGYLSEETPFNITLPIASYPDYFIGNTRFAFMLDTIAKTVTSGSGFYVNLSDVRDVPGTQQLQRRRLTLATAMLGYSPDELAAWMDNASSNLSIYPEQGLWPDVTSAMQTMRAPVGVDFANGSGVVASSGGHVDLQVVADVYRREFATAYNQGSPVGALAVIVNATNAAVTVQQTWLRLNYSTVVTMSGSDVQSGGTINTAGSAFTAGTTQVPARDALILIGPAGQSGPGSGGYVSFPTTAIQDTFDRADNATSLGANWTGPTFSGDSNLGISTNTCYNPGGVTKSGEAQMTSLGTFTGPLEAYITLSTFGACGIDYLITGTGSASVNGYRLQPSGSTALNVYRIDGSAFTQILTVAQTLASGDSIGVAVSGSSVHTVWYKPSGGSWTSLGTVTDATHTSGTIGLAISSASASTRLDSFGGGVPVVSSGWIWCHPGRLNPSPLAPN